MTRGHRGSLLLRCRTFSCPFSRPVYPGAPQSRLYQLIRQPGPITDHTFEITFLDPGARACAFTSARPRRCMRTAQVGRVDRTRSARHAKSRSAPSRTTAFLDAGQDRHGDQRHRPFRQQRLPPADGDRHSLPPSGADLACAVPQRGVDAGVDDGGQDSLSVAPGGTPIQRSSRSRTSRVATLLDPG